MKTETQIARDLLYEENNVKSSWQHCESHKATCKRWLEFLKDLEEKDMEGKEDGNENPEIRKILNKLKDLKQAIKLYKDAGI